MDSYRDLCSDPAVRRALAERDIGEVYRRLIAAGVRQEEIARAVGQKQSEVSDILAGRRVQSVAILERIADGLDVPRGWLGLAYTSGPYTGVDALLALEPVEPTGDPPGAQEVDEDVKRRNFINAIAGAVVWGHPILTDLLTAPRLTPTPLPSRLTATDVESVRALTARMRGVARLYGGQAATISAIARRYTRLLAVAGADLRPALAELHTLAGWAAFDSGAAPDIVRGHFSQAMELAEEAGDHYLAADAIFHAGITMGEAGHPNDGLKLFQLAQLRLGHDGDPVLTAWCSAQSAKSLAQMDRPDLARKELAKARNGWEPPNRFEQADMDKVSGLIEFWNGRVNVAEQFVATSVATWNSDDRRDGVLSDILLATIHLTAREPDGAYLAQQALDGVAELSSSRARARLAPLEQALLARRDSTCTDLAHRARGLRMSA